MVQTVEVKRPATVVDGLRGSEPAGAGAFHHPELVWQQLKVCCAELKMHVVNPIGIVTTEHSTKQVLPVNQPQW